MFRRARGSIASRAVRDISLRSDPLSCGSTHRRPSARPTAEKSLAPREREILRHIASGQTTKEIAAALGVGTKTVETHRRRMMEKLNRHSVAELTKYAVLEGLTPLESGA